MKITVTAKALREAMKLAKQITSEQTFKPVLQCVKLVASKKNLTILATDLELGMRYKVKDIQIEQEGEALVSADKLDGIVRGSSDDEVLTIEADKDTCHIRGAKSHFKILTYDPAEYPETANFTGKGDFKISESVLAGMIGKTLFATAKQHSHYAISGVLWEIDKKKLCLIATDGHRLALARSKIEESKELKAIVPAKTMEMIQKIATSDDELNVKIEEKQLSIKTKRATITSSLIEGNFPRYEEMIGMKTDRKATINVEQFNRSVELATLLTNEESRGVKLSFRGKEVEVFTQSPAVGEAKIACPIVLKGEDIEISFVASHITDFLRVVDTEEFSLEMVGPDKPGLFKFGKNYVYTLATIGS